MPKKKKSSKKSVPVRTVNFIYKKRHVQVLLDKVLIFRLIRNLHGRFWGVAAISGMLFGFSVCFLIRPEMLSVSTAFSDFGNDIRTAPYFAGSVFFGAYGMWRWRNYLQRTWKHSRIVTGLVSLTMMGLYLIALMPVSWRPVPYYIHMFGVGLVGFSVLASVIIDGLLSKSKAGKNINSWRIVRLVSSVMIIVGGMLTFGSAEPMEWFKVPLLGEILLFFGYYIWIVLKTYQGEGNDTVLARILNKLVYID
ncbi:MAG TPA: hypothetical protein VF809_02420 [Candidatus Saccharimonadales bacterium]